MCKGDARAPGLVLYFREEAGRLLYSRAVLGGRKFEVRRARCAETKRTQSIFNARRRIKINNNNSMDMLFIWIVLYASCQSVVGGVKALC